MKTGQNQRVLILGAARQGLALARYLSSQGAKVTLNDSRSAEQLQPAMQEMHAYPVQWQVGGHPLELLDQADLVCISGGVPLTLSLVIEAQRRGIPLSNDSQIFMEAVPCPVIGITGSAGKTTTTTLVGRIAKAAAPAGQQVWVGGNIGLPLIDHLSEIRPADLVVLELSSFQLELMTCSPHVGAVLNITPNHLDRHGTLEAYTAAKAHILTAQTEQDIAVLGLEDPGAWGLAPLVRGRLVTFSFRQPPAGQAGTFFEDRVYHLSDGHQTTPILPAEAIPLRGDHNRLNVLAACAIAYAAGMFPQAMADGVKGFAGVPHRLEFVRQWNGVSWYNDSIATAPERAMAAIYAFEEPIVLLLGGRDKKLPWDKLAELIHGRVDHVVVFGEAADKIMAAIGSPRPGERLQSVRHCSGLHEAVEVAAQVATPGDVVLLSPGGTSFDEFNDFEERGEYFRKWVAQLS